MTTPGAPYRAVPFSRIDTQPVSGLSLGNAPSNLCVCRGGFLDGATLSGGRYMFFQASSTTYLRAFPFVLPSSFPVPSLKLSVFVCFNPRPSYHHGPL